MSKSLEELPLFLLNTVLFPYAHIRLHVFEDRYRTMIRNCVEYGKPFGMVLIREGEESSLDASPYLVGTECEIRHVDYLEKGNLDILVYGGRRFRIREFDETNPFLVGLVEPLAEVAGSIEPEDPTFVQVKDDFELLIRRMLVGQELNAIQVPDNPVVLSFTIASWLPMDQLEKQRLLETTDTLERYEALHPILRRMVGEETAPRIRRVSSVEFQDWASSN